VEGILASIAEFYSANLGQEIRKGMDQKAAQGGWPGRAPFGYRNFRRDSPGRRGESVLKPDEQAPLVVWAFEHYATDSLSLEALTKALSEKGLRNGASGGTPVEAAAPSDATSRQPSSNGRSRLCTKAYGSPRRVDGVP
jgi:site-specific DNA recombinase